MNKVKKSELVEGKEVTLESGEVVILVSPSGEEVTYIDEEYIDEDRVEESYDEDSGELTETYEWGEVRSDPSVLGSQRWLVDVQPKTKFDKVFRTHREIHYTIGNYKVYSINPEGYQRAQPRKLTNYNFDNLKPEFIVDSFLKVGNIEIY